MGTIVNVTGNNLAQTLKPTLAIKAAPAIPDDYFVQGLGGNDTLDFSTSTGNDTLNGGTGNDVMKGGKGNDTYYVDSASDSVVELAGEGTDTIISTVTLNLSTFAAQVEKLTLAAGNLVLNGTGNALANTMTGNDAANTLSGGAGNDTLYGGLGTDALNGDADNDVLYGGDGNDTLRGGAGSDSLSGDAGADNMDGGAGGDTYYVDSASDIVVDSGLATDGIDTIITSVSLTNPGVHLSIEAITLVGAATTVTGNAANNLITGNALANTLVGMEGNDALLGGNGNDSLSAGAGADMLFGGADQDRLDGGTEDDQLFGGDGDDTLVGGAGSDSLVGDAGADSMDGGAGSDQYYVDNVGDLALDSGNAVGDVDTVFSQLDDYTLDASIENLTLGGLAIDGWGTGNSSANTMLGNTGNNALFGLDGNDTLSGDAGHDVLDGGAGVDSMRGGTGDDTYYIDTTSDSVTELLDEGSDTVIWTQDAAGSNLTLQLADNVETLVMTGLGTFTKLVTGNALDNTIFGSDGMDNIKGALGNDTLAGGSGLDTYVFRVGDGQDTIYEQADTVITTLSNGGIQATTQVGGILSMSGFTTSQLRFAHGTSEFVNDLVITVTGSTDRVTVANWFETSNNQIDLLVMGSAGITSLSASTVNNLVAAMAASAPAASMSTSSVVSSNNKTGLLA